MTEAETLQDVPADLQAAFVTVLRPDERLLWAGLPRRGIQADWSDAPRMILGLLLLASACGPVSETGTGQAGSPPDLTGLLILPLMSALLALAGLYCLCWRISWNAYRRRHALYAVTTERALIWYRGRSNHITDISLTTLQDLVLKEGPDDGGTIILGRDRRISMGWPKYWTVRAPRFELTDKALWVYRLIDAVRQRSYWLPN